MNIQEMKEFTGQRIDSLENKDVNNNLINTNGILIQFIPENLLITNNLDWNKEEIRFRIKHSFRKMTSCETIDTDYGDKIISYTPDNEYCIYFQNGITEMFKHPIILKNSRDPNFDYIKVDNLFIIIKDFIDANKTVHEKLYKTTPPYQIFISLIDVQGAYFASFENNKYTTTVPVHAKNVRFEPFQLNSLADNIMPKIIINIHKAIKGSTNWKPMS